jgi:hypothetical protein
MPELEQTFARLAQIGRELRTIAKDLRVLHGDSADLATSGVLRRLALVASETGDSISADVARYSNVLAVS